MSPELISALRERIKQGQAKEVTKAEVLMMGHSKEVFENAYRLAEGADAAVDSSPTVNELPSIVTLIKEGFDFAKNNLTLTFMLAVPVLVSLLAMEVGTWFPSSQLISTITNLIAAFSFLVYLFSLTAAFYLLTTASSGKIASSKSGLLWARKNFFSFFFITILTTLIVLGGFLLFIIPGIILSITVFFGAYVFVHEDVKGMSALTRSRALVKGRWWNIAVKVTGISLFVFATFFLLGIIVGIIDGLSLATIEDTLIFDLIFEPLAAFVTIVIMYASNQLFFALQKETTVIPIRKKVTFTYWFLVIAGMVLVGLFIRFAISIMNDPELLNTPMSAESKLLQEEVKALSGPALSFANTQVRSFVGVCATLTPLVTKSSGDVVCNDSMEAWALAASVRGETWCADSSGFAKKIFVPLESRTSCIES